MSNESQQGDLTPAPKLSLKQLDERLLAFAENIEGRLESLEEQLLGPQVDVANLLDRMIALEDVLDKGAGVVFDGLEVDISPPEGWHLEIIEALIEALRGVRLAGAQSYAIALQEKYFPTEEVERNETVTI